MSNIIVTYFEPFGGRKTNSSCEVVRELIGKFDKIGMPVSWDRSIELLNKIMVSEPRYLFLIGESGKIKDAQVEVVAHNLANGIDNDGVKKDKVKIDKDGPDELYTNLDLSFLDETSISHDGGDYLCNYVYYHALKKNVLSKIVFIHVPFLHSKGQRSKGRVVGKLQFLIDHILLNDKDFLIRVGDKVIPINEQNAVKYIDQIKKEHHFKDVIVGIDKDESTGEFVMHARNDGLKGIWYEYGKGKEEELIAYNKLMYRVISYQNILRHKGEDELFYEKTFSYSVDEYTLERGNVKKYMKEFIINGDYASEVAFYRSIRATYNNIIETKDDSFDYTSLLTAKDYISRLGMERCKEILKKIVKVNK